MPGIELYTHKVEREVHSIDYLIVERLAYYFYVDYDLSPQFESREYFWLKISITLLLPYLLDSQISPVTWLPVNILRADLS
jgi:hypothetical protein